MHPKVFKEWKVMIMNKDEIRQLLPLYIEGELEPALADQVKSAVNADAELQQHVRELQGSWEMLDQWDGVEPQANYVSKFWTRLSAEEKWYEPMIRFIQQPRLVPVFATAMIVILVSTAVIQYGQHEQKLVQKQQVEEDIIQNLELVENYEIIEEIEFFEELDFIDEFGKVQSLRRA